ncbi:MAG TPA: phosphatase PAP2 family protein [Flavobacteriales bacterium]|nr:phosphatase PAP2 family protein [Flavobacteriales bacterium]HIO72058.1 phosphatase PAP2 family protein [Flavobacteriales bacterium]
MIDFITAADTKLFMFLNGMHSELMDPLMVLISGKFEWIPLYILLLALIGIKIGWKNLIIILPFVFLLVVLTDQSSVMIKNLVARLRPCHDPLIMGQVHTVNEHCGGQFSFVSSHAANTFGLAIFVGLLLKPIYKHMLLILAIWALVVSYSRIYLGVHYPLDIVMGALLGGVTGCYVHRLYACQSGRIRSIFKI